MWQGHSTSISRMWRLRWLSGLAGAALLSSPSLAEEITAAEPLAEQVEPGVQRSLLADTGPEIVAAPEDYCAPVRLADSAMIAPAAPPPASKASAILGGEISSLDRIRMAQSGIAMPAIAPIQPMPMVAAEQNDHVETRPAMMTATPRFDACHNGPQIARGIPSIADDRLILGSLRLSIRKTPFDQKWGKVTQPGAARGLKRWLARTGASGETDRRTQVAAINSWVNGQIAYTDDRALYRQSDFWASSRETLRRGKGDCEDYAILKMDLLSALGIDRDKMILVVARDLVRNADHAVLVVQLADGPVVLDNATDRLLDGRLANDYRPIMSFASNGKWLHGYAVAAAAPQPTPPMPAPVVPIAALSAPSMPATLLSAPVSAGN
jgi:predicted transglutaminase-like cysteine proteinase